MKTEELQAQGLTDEQIRFVMAENGKDIEREKGRANAYKSQLDTAAATLKSFEGVNVEELRTKITTLTNDLAAQKAAYQTKLADMEFDAALDEAIRSSSARDAVSVKANLDIETLKASKNRSEDIKAAIEKVKTEKGFLFGSEELPRVVSFTRGPDKNTDNATTKANEALRALYAKGE